MDKAADLASSKQLLFSQTLHLCSKFHRQPGYEGLGPESALFTHTAEPSAQSSQGMRRLRHVQRDIKQPKVWSSACFFRLLHLNYKLRSSVKILMFCHKFNEVINVFL